jgi:hypothetical protein
VHQNAGRDADDGETERAADDPRHADPPWRPIGRDGRLGCLGASLLLVDHRLFVGALEPVRRH